MSQKFYITTPIYYVNAEPHIGHTYTTVAADVLARYHRMVGHPTFFLTGTDEHGEKIEECAVNAGLEPQIFVDEVAAKFESIWDTMNISNDNFIRTTNPDHIKAVQNALQKLYDAGHIYKGTHEGLYCKGCEQYKTEKDLVDGKCPDHQIEPEVIKEETYMFKLSVFADELKEKIESDELMIRPESKKKEILSFYEQGLNDISFSRTKTKWGVPLPWDPEHVAYVWPDAFLNYLTGLGWDGGEEVPHLWPADVELMSKDIIRVHATIWPAILLGLELPLPKQLFVHGFFLVDGQKMSKSIGNVIAPNDLITKYGVDASRYLLMSATPFGHDGDIGWKKFDAKYSADLANDLGNLVNRVLAMAEKYCDGVVPEKAEAHIAKAWPAYQLAMREIRLHDALDTAMQIVREANQYIEQQQPWQLAKLEETKMLNDTMYILLETLRHVAWMVYPFMPETAQKILNSLDLTIPEEFNESAEYAWVWGGLAPAVTIKKIDPLFPRLED